MYIYVYIQLGVYFKFKEYFKKAILEKKIDTLFTKKTPKIWFNILSIVSY